MGADSNRRKRFCRPPPNHSATLPCNGILRRYFSHKIAINSYFSALAAVPVLRFVKLWQINLLSEICLFYAMPIVY
jgi:hypothetical protein